MLQWLHILTFGREDDERERERGWDDGGGDGTD
jgi:hypothetical protein